MPWASSQALRPAGPKRSVSAFLLHGGHVAQGVQPEAAQFRLSAAGRGSRSTGWGARKPAASGGTLVAPRGWLARAAT